MMIGKSVDAAMDAYFRDVLEPARRSFGGFPACPYVRAERLAGEIFITATPIDQPPHIEQISREFFATRSDGTLLVVDPGSLLTKNAIVGLGISLSEQMQDVRIVAIGLHPGDHFDIAGFETRSSIPYITLLVQTADTIRKAKESLSKTNYYQQWSEEDLQANYEQIGRFL